jgi:hypothetical protein
MASTLFAPKAQALTVHIQSRVVIDAHPPDRVHYEKAIIQGVRAYLGTDQCGYIYTAPHTKTRLECDGPHYERTRAITLNGKTGFVASIGGNTFAFVQNSPTSYSQIRALSARCHDIMVADLDGDGKDDFICTGNSKAWAVFQNSPFSWTPVPLATNASDGIGIYPYNGRNNIVYCSGTYAGGNLNWYQNPGGSRAREFTNWTSHLIAAGGCTNGVTISGMVLTNPTRNVVVQASNETAGTGVAIWPPGLGIYDPGTNPFGRWTLRRVDPSYPWRNVHDIVAGLVRGVPVLVAAEQEQTARSCNYGRLSQSGHPDECLVAAYPWKGSSFGAPTIISTLGSHNITGYPPNNGTASSVLYVAGTNHNVYGAVDPSFWQIALTVTP